MKKILLPIIVLLACLDVQAQRGSNITSSTSMRVVRIVEKKPKKPIIPFNTIHYVKSGLNINTIAEDSWGEMMSNSGFPGFHLVYGMDMPFVQIGRSCLFWGYEAGGTISSFSLNGETLTEITNSRSPWPDYYDIYRYGIQLSPKLGAKLGGPKFSIGIDVGCYVKYDLYSRYSLLMDTGDNGYSEYVETYNPLMDILVGEKLNKFDAGLFIGGGLWIKRFYMGVRYSIGIDPFMLSADEENYIVIPTESSEEYLYKIPEGYGARHHNVYISLAWRL